MKKNILRWSAYAGISLLALLVFTGCDPVGTVPLGSIEPSNISTSESSTRTTETSEPESNFEGSYIAYVQWNILPAPWYISSLSFTGEPQVEESWDHDGSWSIGSLLQNYSSGEVAMGADGVPHFEATWNSIPVMDEALGSISLTFDEEQKVITQFYAENSDRSGENITNVHLKGTNIPLVSSNLFEVTGVETCNHIPAGGAYMHSQNFLKISGVKMPDGAHVCNESSFIRIQLMP